MQLIFSIGFICGVEKFRKDTELEKEKRNPHQAGCMTHINGFEKPGGKGLTV